VARGAQTMIRPAATVLALLLLPAGCTSADSSQHPDAQAAGVPVPASSPRSAPARDGAATVERSPSQAMKPARGIFGPQSVWSLDVSHAPLHADSAALVANLVQQVAARYGGVAAFNVAEYAASFYRARGSTRKVDVIFDDCQHKGYSPPELFDSTYGAPFEDVPIPARAIPSPGTDGELSIWDPQTGRLWEFWQARRASDGWHACWGGRIDDVKSSAGFFEDNMGVSATGLPFAAAVVGIAEVRRGVITHAMGLNIVDAANWSEFSYPAQRSDGSLPPGTLHAIEEGQRFRLDPTLDVSTLGLSPVAQMIAKAAQTYGFIVNDKGGAVAVIGETGAGQASLTGESPWNDFFDEGRSYDVLRGFPWDRLQALPRDYGRPQSQTE
jgi:hypothetical protein